MNIELIDRLRCPAVHEDSWLVAAATRTVDRRIVEGTLGCPVCGAEYAIRAGAVWFGGADAPAVASMAGAGADAPIRLAAMLGLDERGGVYVLDGSWGALLSGLAIAFPDAHFVLLATRDAAGAGAVLRGTGEGIPLAAGSARGVALERASSALAQAATAALAPKGRLVAPAVSGVPAAFTVLARDNAWWVGERASAAPVSALVTPRRAAPRTGNR